MAGSYFAAGLDRVPLLGDELAVQFVTLVTQIATFVWDIYKGRSKLSPQSLCYKSIIFLCVYYRCCAWLVRNIPHHILLAIAIMGFEMFLFLFFFFFKSYFTGYKACKVKFHNCRKNVKNLNFLALFLLFILCSR